MPFLEGGAPACVIDDDVEKQSGAVGMGGTGELAELIDARGAFVEDHQGGIDGEQILDGIRAAEPAEPGIGVVGVGVTGSRMQDAAAEFAGEERELGDEIAERARWRNDGEFFRIEQCQPRIEGRAHRGDQLFCGTEHAREGAINRVVGPVGVGMNAHTEIGSVGPMLAPERIDGVGLGLEETGFGEGKGQGPAAFGIRANGEVTP